jgi:hypothetical protein
LNAVRCTFDECQRINIAKLRQRFPDKFTEYDANNRDLFAERSQLESNVVGALARGYCTPENANKVLDRNLINAMAVEVVASADLKPLAKPFPRIDNWIYVGNVLIGDVSGHPRLGTEQNVRTSFVIEMNEEAGFARTRNTVYVLGTPYDTTKQPTQAQLDEANSVVKRTLDNAV